MSSSFESVLAEISARKFGSHIPLYRIAEEIGLCGVRISYKLLSKWVVLSGFALKPLYEVMKEKILAEKNIYIDETPVDLQASPTCKTAYMWVIVGGQGPNQAYRV